MICSPHPVVSLLFCLIVLGILIPGTSMALSADPIPSATVDENRTGSAPGHGFSLEPEAVRNLPRHSSQMVHPDLPDDNRVKPAPALVQRMHRDLLTRIMRNSSDPGAIQRFMATRLTPPQVWTGGLPSKGSPRSLVILVDFPDSPALASQGVQDVASKMFGEGGYTPETPKENLRRYYQRSSFNQLDLRGDVIGWYRSPHTRQEYLDLAADYQARYGGTYGPRIGIACARSDLLYNALDALDAQIDLSRYDSDGDGAADAIYLKYAGEPGEWASLFWATQASYVWSEGTFDGVQPGEYVFSWYSSEAHDASYPLYRPSTDIHETGHLLGLPDYYDYDSTVGPKGGVGGWDMMDANWGDHNVFSKYLLGWLTPTIVSSGSQVLDLQPASVSRDAVLVMPGASLDTYAEFFMAEYRVPGTGVVPQYILVPSGDYYSSYGDYSRPGLMIWHVDARLDGQRTDFAYDNSYSSHKLLRLMEADGREHLEHQAGSVDGNFDLDDLYGTGSVFSPSSQPGSTSYQGATTGVNVRSLSQTSVSGRVSIGTVTRPVPVQPSVISPTDPNDDGRYEDVNGNGRRDFADVVLLFNELEWIAANEPIEAFDFNGNGRIDFDDVVELFNGL